MLNLHNLKHNKEAFTLVEVMLLLVVLSLVFASSVSLITRKHKLKPRRSVHGQYICFREPETGVLRQVKYSGKSLLQDQREIDKCTFEAPNNSSYMYIMLVGAGGAGGNANHKAKTADLYEGPYYIDFLKNLTYGPGYANPDGSNEVAGITDDDVRNDATWTHQEKDKDGNVTSSETVPFSVLAFKKILADNHVKIFAYDYAGDGDNSGGMQYNAYTRNEADGDDKANWYRSFCTLHGDSGTMESAKNCLRYLMKEHKNEVYGTKCVLRDPISKNCPYLHKYFEPVVGLKDGEEYRPLYCGGRAGEKGALIFTRERDFGTGISYANGKRYRVNNSTDGVIDWTYWALKDSEIHANRCIVGISFNSRPKYTDGTFMTYDEALGSLNLKSYNNNGALNKYINKDAAGFVQTAYDNAESIYDSGFNTLYQTVFKTYPSVENMNYSMFTQWGLNAGRHCEDMRSDKKIAGEDGKNGGLPFFNRGNKGVKICVNGTCQYEAFSSYRGGTTYTDATAGGRGGKGLEINYDLFDNTDFTFKKNECPDTPSPTVDTKTRILSEFDNMGPSSGNPFFSCTGRVGFSYSNSSITGSFGGYYSDYAHLLRINPKNDAFWDGEAYPSTGYNNYYSYKCPALDHLRTNDSDSRTQTGFQQDRAGVNSIGLKISHYISRSVLHHGEHGTAGESKTLFARSFGAADITMLPGLEGKKKDIVTATDATDEDRATSAGNGKSSTFGIGCHTQEDGELKCDYKLVAKGGAGGAGFVEEEPAFSPLEKEKIVDYVKKIKNGTATAPDKYSDSYVDGSYEGEDSDFQQIAYLSDFPGTDARDIIKKLGKGGNGGYVHHKCWLQPQYFKYHYKNWYFGSKYYYGNFTNDGTDKLTFNDWVKEKSDFGVTIPNVEGTYNRDEFEGYTAFTEDIIKRIGVCGADGKEPQDQFDEIQGTDGYPGAIVIMW